MISSVDSGLTGTEYYKSSEYHKLLSIINEKQELKGSLKCSLKLALYFQLPQGDKQEMTVANTTLNEAFDCFIGEDFPFYMIGCKLKYQINKDMPHVDDEGYFMSECMSGVVMY